MSLYYNEIENNTIKKGEEITFSFNKLIGFIDNGNHRLTNTDVDKEDLSADYICWNVNISSDIAILDRPYSADVEARMDSLTLTLKLCLSLTLRKEY